MLTGYIIDMNNFRKPRPKKRKLQSVDGLLQKDQTAFSRNRFSDNYSPKKIDPETGFKRSTGKKIASKKLKTADQEPIITIKQEELEAGFKSNLSDEDNLKQQDPSDSKSASKLKKSKRKRAKLSPFKKIRRIALALVVVVLLSGASLAGYVYFKTKSIFKGDGTGAAALIKDVDPNKLNSEGDGRINILLLGKGGQGHTAPDLTDTILLASINPVDHEAVLISVPRDMYIINEYGGRNKINSVYSNAKQSFLARNPSNKEGAEKAGLAAIENSVSEVLGVPIHYYTMVDFKAFEKAINTVGGIEIDVKKRLVDPSLAKHFNNNPVIAEQGLQKFNGWRALAYSRSRKTSLRGDFDRTARQQEVIIALQKKVLSLGTFSNPVKIVELINALGDHVRTDLNGIDEIQALYQIGKEIDSENIKTVGLADPPNILVKTGMMDNQSVVFPAAGLDNYAAIRKFVRNQIKDSYLTKENARVIILNGTSQPGLASSINQQLESYGYNVVGIDNAPTADYVQNKLIDNNPGKNPYTKNYLQKRLELTTETSSIQGLPGGDQADFVIILGTDEINKTRL